MDEIKLEQLENLIFLSKLVSRFRGREVTILVAARGWRIILIKLQKSFLDNLILPTFVGIKS